MGTLIGSPQVRASFQQQLFPSGLDLNRGDYRNCKGVWRANVGANFYAGQPVMQNSVGEIVLSDGTQILGVAKWSKVTVAQTTTVDFPVVFPTANSTVNLKPNIVSGTFQLNSVKQPDGGGTKYTGGGTDYSINLTNGTITQVGAGAIPLNTTVYASFAWQPTNQDIVQLEGVNFWQTLDYVTIQDLRVAVVQAPAEIYTTFFDPSQAYAYTGVNSNVYVNSSGLFTSVVGSNKLVGRVINVPTNADPYLGIEFFGQVVADT